MHERRTPVGLRFASRLMLALAAVLASPWPAAAKLDIENGGPKLSHGNFEMRVTNAGIIGNAFSGSGLSFDSSFEFPSHSGREYLNYGALWVGARLPTGEIRVSGGPNLEWRPTQDPADSVLVTLRSQRGVRRLHDDDGDGATDEEWLDGRDDDADGLVDEDAGIESDQMLTAQYTDFERASIQGLYPNGETHTPLHLSVRQVARAWSTPALHGLAGISFQVSNRGPQALRDVYLGFLADLDVRRTVDASGHTNDMAEDGAISFGHFLESTSYTFSSEPQHKPCYAQLAAPFVAVHDRDPFTHPGAVAVVPLDHTRDPLAAIPAARSHARAPYQLQFSTSTFLPQGHGRGSLPVIDSERYAALRGQWPSAPARSIGDQVALISCGPFGELQPGATLEFSIGLVAVSHRDSLENAIRNLLILHYGTALNLLPDVAPLSERDQYASGISGTFGHEVCVEAPPGVTFSHDPHCTEEFGNSDIAPVPVDYRPGECVWTNADCDFCTGINGKETVVRWTDDRVPPPSPEQRVDVGDRQVRISWNNTPEILIAAGHLGSAIRRVVGYRVYKLADWRRRSGSLPDPRNWALLRAFSVDEADTTMGEAPLASITNTSLDYEDILYEQRRYPIGRYQLEDHAVHNGFDYAYRVVTVAELESEHPAGIGRPRIQSPLVADLGHVVRPKVAAGASPQVWAVPNPYRAQADWDRPPVPGDALGRHIDFMGLPRARSTIKIWTVAGDFVAQIDHDGSGGDGQASWNLISRNGQDVESGIYLFTVHSALGESKGRFVIIR